MEKCPVENCKEVGDMKRTLYGGDGAGGLVACSKKLDRDKVSWKQLGITVGVIMVVLGGTYLKVDWGVAGDIGKVEKHCDENAKNIQKFSIDQAVIAEKVTDIDRTLTKIAGQREKDLEVIHLRITNNKDEIIKAIRAIKK